MENFDFYINMYRNIFVTFFQNAFWVVAFFYLLNKTYQHNTLIKVSKFVTFIVLVVLIIHSFNINR